MLWSGIHGKPARIVSANGTEFTSRAILKWAEHDLPPNFHPAATGTD